MHEKGWLLDLPAGLDARNLQLRRQRADVKRVVGSDLNTRTKKNFNLRLRRHGVHVDAGAQGIRVLIESVPFLLFLDHSLPCLHPCQHIISECIYTRTFMLAYISTYIQQHVRTRANNTRGPNAHTNTHTHKHIHVHHFVNGHIHMCTCVYMCLSVRVTSLPLCIDRLAFHSAYKQIQTRRQADRHKDRQTNTLM